MLPLGGKSNGFSGRDLAAKPYCAFNDDRSAKMIFGVLSAFGRCGDGDVCVAGSASGL